MKRFLLPLLAVVSLPNFVRANPAIYAPQICTMLQSNISINKAWKYVTQAQRQQIVDRERTFGGYQTEIGWGLSAGIEAKKVLGGMYEDVLALTLSQCPDYFWKGWENNDGSGVVIKNPGSLGFVSILINGTRYIAAVREGGDAFAKGIKPGSIILSINNENILNIDTKKYEKMMPKNIGENVTLLIEYEGEQEIYELNTVPSENIKWAKGTKIRIKKSKIKKDSSSGSVNVNCDSPVWKNKPRCS